MADMKRRRPGTLGRAGRRPKHLPQKFVQQDRNDGADQAEHRANNTDRIVTALAIRAGVFLTGHYCGVLSTCGHRPEQRPTRGHLQLQSCNPTHNMKTSLESCDRAGWQGTPFDLDDRRGSCLAYKSSLLRPTVTRRMPSSVPSGEEPQCFPNTARFVLPRRDHQAWTANSQGTIGNTQKKSCPPRAELVASKELPNGCG